VIAYSSKTAGSKGAENKVYAPGGIEITLDTSTDYFYDLGKADSTYKPLSILFYPLPADAVTLIKEATDLADVAEWMAALETFVDTVDSEDNVPATVGTGFLVFTSEKKYVAVIITAGGTAATVTLGTTGLN